MDTERWADRDSKVEVTRPEGFMMRVCIKTLHKHLLDSCQFEFVT